MHQNKRRDVNRESQYTQIQGWAQEEFVDNININSLNPSRISMAKATFNKNRTLFTSTLDLELRKKLVKCYICSTALYGAETWTLRAVD